MASVDIQSEINPSGEFSPGSIAIPADNSHLYKNATVISPEVEFASPEEFKAFKEYKQTQKAIKSNKATLANRAEIIQNAIFDAFIGKGDENGVEEFVKYIQTIKIMKPGLAVNLLTKAIELINKQEARREKLTALQKNPDRKHAPIIIAIGNPTGQTVIPISPKSHIHEILEAKETIESPSLQPIKENLEVMREEISAANSEMAMGF